MKKLITMTALAVVLTCSEANASGFYLKEQSAAAQGNAYAGATAGAEDISYSYFNPAALAYHSGTNMELGGTWISPTSVAKNANNGLGEHNDYMGNIVHAAASPQAYFSHQINDQFTAGISLNTPFGMITKYPDDWAGRNHGTLSKIISATFTPMVAYKYNDQLSFGAGIPVQYIKAQLRNSVTPMPGVEDKSTVKGDTIDVGYQLGAMYEPIKGTRFGAGYRSKIKHKIKGDIDFDGLLAQMNQDVSARLTTPATLNIGAYHQINDDWAVMAEYSRVFWSSFDKLEIKGKTISSITEEKWKDTDFYALGINKKLDDQWKLRLGVAYEKGAVNDEYRTPRIPDSSRLWYSAGLEYKYNEHLTFNVGYTHIAADSAKVNLRGDHRGDDQRGALSAEYSNKIHIVAGSLTYHF
ncbi:MAG: outer membrane protein transport protein [Alphaproteobacteria bacterium]|nr:outer membrane protein transport protein [Alphaproteobacteria bacterium]